MDRTALKRQHRNLCFLTLYREVRDVIRYGSHIKPLIRRRTGQSHFKGVNYGRRINGCYTDTQKGLEPYTETIDTYLAREEIMDIDWKDVDYATFGQMVHDRMDKRGFTISDLAEELEMPRSLIAFGLSGRRRISPIRMQQVAQLFDISANEIPLRKKPKETPTLKGKKIFISYSHKDHEYLDRLMVHLKPLEKQGLIDPWVDTRLLAGDKWKKEIEKALKSAKVAVLMISADFLASDFIIDNELPPLLQAAEQNGTLIIPVILKPCRFTREKTLREFQAINPPDEPLCLLNENERELVYDTIAQRIEDTFD